MELICPEGRRVSVSDSLSLSLLPSSPPFSATSKISIQIPVENELLYFPLAEWGARVLGWGTNLEE